RVLAIDGGCIRGIIPATVLADLETRAGRPIADLFDLIAGTSTGGILALGLALPGEGGKPAYRPGDLLELYVGEGPNIFRRSIFDRIRSLDGAIDERYPADGLERVLKEALGEARLRDALTGVVVTAYDTDRRQPFFFRSARARQDAAYDSPMHVGAHLLRGGAGGQRGQRRGVLAGGRRAVRLQPRDGRAGRRLARRSGAPGRPPVAGDREPHAPLPVEGGQGLGRAGVGAAGDRHAPGWQLRRDRVRGGPAHRRPGRSARRPLLARADRVTQVQRRPGRRQRRQPAPPAGGGERAGRSRDRGAGRGGERALPAQDVRLSGAPGGRYGQPEESFTRHQR